MALLEPSGCLPDVFQKWGSLAPQCDHCGMGPSSLEVTLDSWNWEQLLLGKSQLYVELMEFPSIFIVYEKQMTSDSEK